MTLCSGIGAPEMAAPWIDWRFASEIDAFPSEVLSERFGYKKPEDHNQGDPLPWDDMCGVTPELIRSKGIPLPDILVAGTPCQSFSLSGLRKGLEDDRGNLTLKFVEICHAIVDAKPDGKLRVLWENVPGVLSDKGNAFGCFLAGIVGAGSPFVINGSWPSAGMVDGPRARAAWRVLDAQYFGVPQRRKRVFVVVDFGNAVDPARVLFESKAVSGDIEACQASTEAAAFKSLDCSRRVFTRQSHGEYKKIGVSSTLSAHDSKDISDLVLCFDPNEMTSPTNQSKPKPELCHTLTARTNPPTLFSPVVRRFTPNECARLQGFTDNHCQIEWRGKPAPPSKQYKAYGNSMAVPVVAWILDRIKEFSRKKYNAGS